MPGPTQNPEAVARSVIEKGPPTGRAATHAEQRADRIRKDLEVNGPRKTIESFRVPRTNQSQVDNLNERNFGTNRNSDGTVNRDTEERIRFGEAKKLTSLGKDYLEKGFDPLDPARKTEIRKAIEGVYNLWPDGKLVLDGMSPTDKQAFLDRVAKDPEFVEKVRSAYERATDPSNLLQDNVSEVKKESLDAGRKAKAKQDEIDANNGRRTANDAMLEQFADRTAHGGIRGAKLVELENINNELPTLNSDLEDNQERYEAAREDVRQLEQLRGFTMMRGEDIAGINTQISQRSVEVRALKREITRINGVLQRKTSLESELRNLSDSREQLANATDTLKGEFEQLQETQARSQANLASAKSVRGTQEEGYLDGLRGVFSDATAEYALDKKQAADDAERRVIDDEIAKAVDPAEKALLQGMQNFDSDTIQESGFWKFKTRKSVRILNKVKIDGSFDNLVKVGGGPKEAIKAELIANGISLADAEAKVNDAEFVAKMQPQFLEKLVSKKLQVGGMTEEDARRVVESDWGDGLIQKALAKNEQVNSALNELVNKGVITGTSAESLRKLSGKNLLWILAMILGSVAVGGLGAASLAAGAISKEGR